MAGKTIWQRRADRLNQRARKLGVQGTVSALELREIVERGASRCSYCGLKLDYITEGRKNNIATFDHVKRLADEGHHEWWNLVCACEDCNLKRGFEMAKAAAA